MTESIQTNTDSMTESMRLPGAVVSTLTETEGTIRLSDAGDPGIVTDYKTLTKDPHRSIRWGRVTFLPHPDLSTGLLPSALARLPLTILPKDHAIPYIAEPSDYSIGAIETTEDCQSYLHLLRVEETEGGPHISYERVRDVRPLVHLFERERIGGLSSPEHDRSLRQFNFAPVSTECINPQRQMQEYPHAIPLSSNDGKDLGRLYFYSPTKDCTYLENGQVVLHGGETGRGGDETVSRYSILMDLKQD